MAIVRCESCSPTLAGLAIQQDFGPCLDKLVRVKCYTLRRKVSFFKTVKKMAIPPTPVADIWYHHQRTETRALIHSQKYWYMTNFR